MIDHRVHIFVSGVVQGVCFRFYTQKKASRLGLCGWVRNCSDGRVEIEAQGKKSEVEKLANWCYQGPSSAEVTRVDIEWINSVSNPIPFHIRY